MLRTLTALLIAAPALHTADAKDPAEDRIAEMAKSGQLFDPEKAGQVRAAFSDLFQEQHEADIKRAFGDDHAALTEWLDARPQIKQDLFTAIDPDADQVGAALTLFRNLWKQFPEHVEAYDQLAIAVAVTWDQPRQGVYDYAGHQRRAKSEMPGDAVDAVGNFKYVVQHAGSMDGRPEALPWEFLVFVVDHTTPVEERLWAQEFVRKSKGRVKSWHQAVPYDHDMLNGERTRNPDLKPKLTGKEYTLANLLEHGGVCAHQADFAARVGKSVGIPAVYCGGKSAYRGSHAWWMFANVAKGRGEKLDVQLRSDGRFEGFAKDQFFTGTLTDPKTGGRVLDRDMERELAAAGADLAAKRQADLAMRAYPWVTAKLELSLAGKVGYLDRTLKLCPHNAAAWEGLARLAHDGDLNSSHAARVVARLSLLFKTFAGYPDFINTVLEDLLTVVTDPKQKLRYVEYAAGAFEKAGRADLSCEARLRATEIQITLGEWKAAAKGLNQTIRKFPTEGRFVPRMTKKYQEVAGQYKNGPTELARLYLELVPTMTRYYGQAGADYSATLYREALDYATEQGLDLYATRLEATGQALGLR